MICISDLRRARPPTSCFPSSSCLEEEIIMTAIGKGVSNSVSTTREPGSGLEHATSSRLSTGILGLDEILLGGLIPRRTYLLRGGPGCGKTTLGLQFLTAGAMRGERCLFITLGESEALIRKNAASVGLDLSHVRFLDLSPNSGFFTAMESYDIFSPAEVEREPTTQKIIEVVEDFKPHRVFLDAMTQFRFLSTDAFQFRKQVLSFLRFLVERNATVLFTSEGSESVPDDDLQFMSDGVIHLNSSPEGPTISVGKFRGSDFRSG